MLPVPVSTQGCQSTACGPVGQIRPKPLPGFVDNRYWNTAKLIGIVYGGFHTATAQLNR